MRRKKHKHTRRAVKFYKIHHGFREPYKVVLDSSFVHGLLQANLKAVTDLTAGLLGGQVRLFTTQCVMHEIKALGKEYKDTYLACKKLQLYKCGHDDAVEAATDCLKSLVGDDNAGHFFVGTQDKQLRTAIGKVPAGASMFISVNGLHLEQPSIRQEKVVHQAAEQQQGLQPSDLKAKVLKDVVDAKRHAQPDINTSIYRHNKAKGPNPMALKKKKRKVQQPTVAQDAEAPEPKQKKARKRRKSSLPVDND
ncbi:hypothetical protein ABBQ32_011256 [Trebouxia sp. C0010 RCD-2024]